MATYRFCCPWRRAAPSNCIAPNTMATVLPLTTMLPMTPWRLSLGKQTTPPIYNNIFIDSRVDRDYPGIPHRPAPDIDKSVSCRDGSTPAEWNFPCGHRYTARLSGRHCDVFIIIAPPSIQNNKYNNQRSWNVAGVAMEAESCWWSRSHYSWNSIQRIAREFSLRWKEEKGKLGAYTIKRVRRAQISSRLLGFYACETPWRWSWLFQKELLLKMYSILDVNIRNEQVICQIQVSLIRGSLNRSSILYEYLKLKVGTGSQVNTVWIGFNCAGSFSSTYAIIR